MGIEKMVVRFAEEGRECRLPGLLYANDLGFLCSESEEDLRERFIEVCRRRGLKVNAVKSNLMMLGGEEGLVRFLCIGYYWRMCQNVKSWVSFVVG